MTKCSVFSGFEIKSVRELFERTMYTVVAKIIRTILF